MWRASLPGTRLSIFSKGIILIALPILFQLGLLLYLFRVHRQVADAERWELHSKQVLEQANAIRLIVSEGHSAIRATNTFRDNTFEHDKRQAMTTIPEQIRQLRDLVADSSAQQARLDQLQDVVQRYLEWAAEMEQLGQAGNWLGYDDHLKAKMGKAAVDAVENQLTLFRNVEQHLDGQRIAETERSRLKQRWSMAAAAGSEIILAIGLVWVFSQSIGVRLAVATDNARRLAQGDTLAEPVQGSDEIADLDAVMHETARRLTEASAKEKLYTEELRRRGDELEQANKELLYKTQENETFVYSVSHDMRSPLVNMQGFTKELSHGCQALREALDQTQLPEPARKRIDTIIAEDIVTSISFIQTAVSRSANIIDALLRLSRAGRVEYQRQAVDLNRVVERVVTSMRISLEEKNAQIAVGELPKVVADPTAVEQIFANLIGNAVNYLDMRRPGHIEVGATELASDNARMATLFVKDNGLGIPAAYVSKLFVAFQRLHGEVAKGEGVGLALVKRIVDRHGGRLWAESTEGEGTVFYVSLPRADGEVMAAATKAGQP